MSIWIISCRPTDRLPIVAWLIMLLQGMRPWKSNAYSHMAIMYVGCTGNQRVIDARGKAGVDDRIRNRFDSEYKVVNIERVEINAAIDEFKMWSEEQEVKLYDKASIAGMALKLLGIFKSNPLGHNWRKMTCNQLVLSFINKFFTYKIGDPDNYDLLMTNQVVRSVAIEQRTNS